MPLDLTYAELIKHALIDLAERKGSSRQALWKYIETKYPKDSNYKQFLLRLKRVNPEEVVHEGGRYKVTKTFREKYLKALK
jgi:hypothetical protein